MMLTLHVYQTALLYCSVYYCDRC